MSKKLSPKPIGSIIADSPLIKSLRQESQKIEQVQDYIRSFLEPELAEQLTVCKRGKDYIVIQVQSSTWAARIRYIVPAIIDNFKRHSAFSELIEVRIRTAVQDHREIQAPVQAKTSPKLQTIENIENFADSMANDELGAALKRLAQSAKKLP